MIEAAPHALRKSPARRIGKGVPKAKAGKLPEFATGVAGRGDPREKFFPEFLVFKNEHT